MKILLVNKFLYSRGGAETYLLKTGAYLRDQGHEVQYFGMYDSRNAVGNALGLATYPMDFRSAALRRYLYPFRILYSGEARKKMRALVDHFKPDIVHLNNINFQLTPSVIDGVGPETPIVQTVHDFQLICPNHLLLNGKTGVPCELCIEGSKWNCARYRCIHGSLPKSILGSLEGIGYQKTYHYDRIDRFICPSRFLESKLAKDRRFAGKTLVLHNFIDWEGEREPAPKKDYVLYFGRLAEEKDLAGLLAACRLCPEIPFIVAGGGPLEPLMRDAPPNLRYVGFQSGEALRTLVAEARFSVYFPVWYENCPLSILESQALGTPVLANRIGGIPELIEQGETGVLNDRFTPEQYALQIQALYRDRPGLERMAENCRRKSEGNSLAVYGRRLLELYESLLEKKRNP
ncbi:MAG: glycosyltransferase family 4 protein [Provencibacterium sp.]|nr:glycosyltransferase family 4 protein [Provencibacterium sp.]